jgi:hypothetical protein
MLWWDWTMSQRLRLLGAMVAIAAIPWLLLGCLPHQWGAFVGGTAFLLIPQMLGWNLFVGLRTGRMPTRLGSEDRRSSPTWFWINAAIYAGLLLFVLWIILAVLADSVMA